MLSKHTRTLDNASPSTTSSPVAYRRTSIPSIIPVSVAPFASANIPPPSRRAPFAPLDPQFPFSGSSLDNQMSPSSSSSTSSQLSYPIPDAAKDGDRAAEIARSYIGRHIISRPQDDPDQALQSARKRSLPGPGNTLRSPPFPLPRSLQQRRPSNTPPTSSSRRPSLPSTQYPQANLQSYSDLSSPSSSFNTASSLEPPPHPSPAYPNSEDLYSGLSTFTFGAAQPLPSPQGSDSSEMVSPLTRVPPASSADRTPRPSIASSNGSSRRARASKASNPHEGDDEYDEDEEETERRKTRSKMRAIDDGTRRPSLPTNALTPPASDEVPPPLPTSSYSGHSELSPGASSGHDSGFEDSEIDDGEPAEFDTDVEFDLQRTHGGMMDPPMSDTASQHTFGTGGYRLYRAEDGDGESMLEDDDDDDDSIAMSPVTFSNEREPQHPEPDTFDDLDPSVISMGPPAVPNKAGAYSETSGASSSRTHETAAFAAAHREREDSAATVKALRESTNVDDTRENSPMDTDNLPSITTTDLMAIELPESPEANHSPSEEAQATEAQNTAQEEYQYGEFDINYILGPGGRQSWSSDRPSYIETRAQNDGGLGADWAMFGSGRRPSTNTVGSDDAFTRQVRTWDGVYAERRETWSFKRESMDGRGPTGHADAAGAPAEGRSHQSSSMPPGTQELWRQTFIGRFKVDRMRMPNDQPGKAPAQRLNIRHIPDPYSMGNTRGGPGTVIHKHSRAIAFSIFRNHALFGRHNSSKQVKPNMSSSASILLATKKVQEQYTSTRTTSKLNSHGLLEDIPRHADGTVFSQSGTVVATGSTSSRSRPSSSSGPQAGRSDERVVERRRTQNGEGSSSDVHEEAGRASVSPPPPSPPPKDHASHRIALSVSTIDIVHEDAQHSAGTDRSSTIYSQSDQTHSFSSSSHAHAMDVEDEEQSPPRTSHAEAFATVDSSYLEHMRNRPEPRHHAEESTSLGLLGAMRRKLLGQGSKSQVATPPPAAREPHYTPPWLTMAPRSKQEERERVIQNLNESFKDVGLLPTVRPNKSSSGKGKRRKHPTIPTNIFADVPVDSLYMLLPLWPGETDAASSELEEDPSTYVVRVEDRQYLLVYYVPFDAEQEAKKKAGDPGKKRTRVDPRPSTHTSGANGERLIALQTFRICARLISYADLRETGVRVPAYGLAITGSMAEAVQNLPPPTERERGLTDTVIGYCYTRTVGMEFVPEGLRQVGLCMPMEALAPPTSEMEQVPEEVVVLTPIGRAAVEMAWLGCMAVTSFGTV